MAPRDPYAVLGVEPTASDATIKAAWRRLARANHPDISGRDAAATRAATRRMAEINAAYQQLRDPARRRAADARRASNGDARTGHRAGTGGGPPFTAPRDPNRPSGPPRPRPTRPVTARLDTTETFRVRNRPTTDPRIRRAYHPSGHPPLRAERPQPRPPRGSDPTGPAFRRLAPDAPPSPRIPLDEAAAHEVGFGKFHGRTLGEIARLEPSYIDWIVQTFGRDPTLLASARAIQADLDARGVRRTVRPPRPGTTGFAGGIDPEGTVARNV